jgi:exodeoxyribonuclease VII small subunit
MNSKNPPAAANSFEASLAALEKIVRRLEEGDLSLEESLKLFESGVKLSRECNERLSHAERRIEVLLKDEQGNPSLQPLEKVADNPPKAAAKRIVFEDEDDDETPF